MKVYRVSKPYILVAVVDHLVQAYVHLTHIRKRVTVLVRLTQKALLL